MLRVLRCAAVLLTMVPSVAFAGDAPGDGAPARGVLLLAHGGRAEWNANVEAIAADVDRQVPTAVAFGMADRKAIAAAVDALVDRGVGEIVAVPLFVSSHSSVLTATEFLLGLRPTAPPELAMFARMSHGAGGGSQADQSHQGHSPDPEAMTPISSPVPIRMTPALDAHPLLADILATRAAALSTRPEREVVVLVAHGPTSEEDDRRWKANLDVVSRLVAQAVPFAAVRAMTVRDDAPPEVYALAAARLRSFVDGATSAGARVLVVPVLLSFGGIEDGIRQRLEGLSYAFSETALAPDARLVTWVLAQAAR